MDIALAMHELRPGAEWFANPDTFEGLRMLDGSAKPTRADLETAELVALAKLDNAEALRQGMLAFFDGLPLGVRIMFKDTADAMRDAFAVGNTALAREILNTTPVPADLAEAKASLLALLPA
jgi:hypothetical protein